MDKLKRALGGNDADQTRVDEERGFVDSALDASTLSWSTRIKGFVACFVIGVVISLLGTVCISLSLSTFAILYSLGNIVALSSTLFLMGPVAQIKRMFAPTRLIATILMLTFLTLTLMSALWWHKKGLAIIFCVMQFCAMTWYSISYIPMAREAIQKCVGGVIS